MSTLFAIAVGTGLWAALFLVLLAVCQAARRGDDALRGDVPSDHPAVVTMVDDPVPPRAAARSSPGVLRHSRLR